MDTKRGVALLRVALLLRLSILFRVHTCGGSSIFCGGCLLCVNPER